MTKESESKIQADILKALTKFQPHIRFWRNNVGAFKNENGRLIRFGLVGSADIQGIISPNGKMLCIECKTKIGKQREEQKRYEKMITEMGGIYILARSVEDVIKPLTNIINKEKGEKYVIK